MRLKNVIIIVLMSAFLAMIVIVGCDSVSGPEDDFTAPASITDLQVDSVDRTTIYISWTAPGDDGQRGTADLYDIRYAEDTITLIDWIYADAMKNRPCPKPAGAKEVFELRGLPPEMEFYIAIKSIDEAYNISEVSNFAGCTSGDDFVVEFPDSNLEAAIRQWLHKLSGDILYSEVLKIDGLSASNREISDLTGLSYLINLENLSLYSNNIYDISPLANLHNLESRLDLSRNHIHDLRPLNNLINLEYLVLGGNDIGDLSPISNLTELQYLHIDDNNIEDLSPLSGLSNLSRIVTSYNQIRNINALSNLTKLSNLELGRNFIENISALSPLKDLEYLRLEYNHIVDLEPLSELVNLYYLNISQNEIENIAALEKLHDLEYFYADHNSIIDLEALSKSDKLCYINLRDNMIEDIGPLVKNQEIGQGDVLYLYDNPLSEKSKNEYIPILQARGATVYYH